MMDFLQDSYQGGEYWGGVGRSPEIDRFFDSGAPGSPPPGLMRFGYAGYYCGILVALVALLTIAQSLRSQSTMFTSLQRRLIWFWTAVMFIGLLLAWGRFAPFYHFVYILPYFSTIRNPIKFTSILDLGMIIIFAYGIDGLSRLYMQPQTSGGKTIPWLTQLQNWKTNINRFDRKWSLLLVIAFALSVLAWIIYSSQSDHFVHYLQKVGFDADMGKAIAAFSLGQVAWSLLFFAVAIALIIMIFAGVFSGQRAGVGGLLLVIFLLADMGRANLPFIIHWNYKQKYASNSIIDVLRDKSYEHRVTELPSDSLFHELYQIEWMQHHFLYYNVQCLDVIQQPRVASDLMNYDIALAPTSDPATVYRVARKWELTNTRYFLGPANFLDQVNQQLDPIQQRFRYVQRFNVVPKPGIIKPTELEQLTAVPDDTGDFALFEFTGALPRVKLYANWEVETNDTTTLNTLTSLNFDPQKAVLVSTPLPGNAPMTNSTGENPGTVDFTSYSPKDIVFSAQAALPSVMLLNDRYDANWKVFVDGQPAKLLRCNYIMRGVFLSPGSHKVEFYFSLPHDPLYVTLAAEGLGIILCVYLYFSTRKSRLAVGK
jgi:hypothetical protein